MFEKWKGTDWILSGLILCIGAAEAVHLLCLFGGKTIGFGNRLFCVLVILGLLLMGGAFLWTRGRRHQTILPKEAYDRTEKVLLLVLMGLFLLQLLFPFLQEGRYLQGDMMVETVNSFLQIDRIYQVNPMTGEAYSVGLPLRIRILGLPTLYTFLCKVLGAAPDFLVWSMIPGAVCFFSYCSFASLAEGLFPQKRKRRLLFLVLVSLLFFCGSYAYGMDGFGLLYCGWRGVTIRNLILLPYTLSLCLRKRYQETLLCILAEACIVWTLYGLGMCIALVGLFVVTNGVCKRFERRKRAC